MSSKKTSKKSTKTTIDEVPETKKLSNYEALGVSSKKEDVHIALQKIDQGLFPSAFCKIIEDVTGNSDYCSVLHTDDVGTKSTIAYMMYKETGDIKYFRGLVHDSIVMNTDDIICVGANEKSLLANTIARNKKLISGEIISAIIDEYEQFSKKLRSLGFPIYTGGGETSDSGDVIRTLFMDSTIMTRMKRSDVILPDNIQIGDVIVGFESCGKATYEDDIAFNSGIGSNGLTLARHGILYHSYYTRFPECVAPEIGPNLAFYGQHDLLEKVPGTPLNVGEAILSPTKTYVPILIPLLKENRKEIHAMFHNTGGGQTKCLKFGKELHYIKDNPFPIPSFFRLVQSSSNTGWEEMYQVFNMGCRMELVCSEEFAKQKVIPMAKKFNVDSRIIGHIEKSTLKDKNQITISSEKGIFKYNS
jgi:phosphoribosylformylglycinamidine cyclo-ligase